MKITLPNGAVVEGTPDQIAVIARSFGVSLGNDGVYYNSTSRGLIKITDMDDTHLANAIRKQYREFAASLSSKSGRDLVLTLRNGPSDKTFTALVAEYARRVSIGRI